MSDSEGRFLLAVREGRDQEALSSLESDPSLLLSSDGEGNTALHLAAVAQRESMVGVLLNKAKSLSPDVEAAFVGQQNGSGKTALEISLQRRHRRISWTIIQSGGAAKQVGQGQGQGQGEGGQGQGQGRRANRISSNSLLQSLPDFENGNNFLHVYARHNYALQIKEYLDGTGVSGGVGTSDDRAPFVRHCLARNGDGDTPAMVAARRRNKEALMALLQPFIVFPDRRELDALLHRRNADGHSLLTFVAHCDKTLSAAHGVLVELESFAHQHDSHKVKECFRASLGSTMSARLSTDLFKRTHHRTTRAERTFLLIKILSLSFVVKSLFLVVDMLTDAMLVKEYYELWEKQTRAPETAFFFPGAISKPTDPCKTSAQINTSSSSVLLSTHVWATGNITLGCYPGAIDGRTRFCATVFFLLLPFSLYFFELLRFRLLSKRLERRYPGSAAAAYVARPLGNLLLWLTWPLVSFFRQFWFRFRFEASEGEKKVQRHRQRARRAALVGSRAQLIEVCTEASLQPLFQFYLVFQEIVQLDLAGSRSLDGGGGGGGGGIFGVAGGLSSLFRQGVAFVLDAHRRQVASVIVSLFVLSWSFAHQYRQNKEGSVGMAATALYFLSVSFLVAARILCFEMFAYYLGPGHLGHALLAAGAHAILMSALHFAFSDSLAQCARPARSAGCGGRGRRRQSLGRWARQVLLVAHNCLLNGLANLYVHNNLEIFVHREPPSNREEEEDSTSKKNKRNKGGAAGANAGVGAGVDELTYVASDVRQRTLVRQAAFDLVFLAENVAMVWLSAWTVTVTPNYAEVHSALVALVAVCYGAGMALKVAFYLGCHPWAELIRPSSSSSSSSSLCTSCVVFSRHLDVSVDTGGGGCCCCRLRVSSNRSRDLERYRSIRHLLPAGFSIGNRNKKRSSDRSGGSSASRGHEDSREEDAVNHHRDALQMSREEETEETEGDVEVRKNPTRVSFRLGRMEAAEEKGMDNVGDGAEPRDTQEVLEQV